MTKEKKDSLMLDAKMRGKLEKAIDEMNLFDDDLMSKVFDGNIEAAELILKIILQRDDIKVLSVKGQVDMKNPYANGRNIRIDVYAIDSKGERFDVEVQRDEKGAHIRRARYNGSMLDTRMLKKKQEFKELKDAYVIFICRHDKFGKGLPVYHVDKVIRETGESYDDGAHIIYLNGIYKGDDDFGRLAHDFNCTNPDEIYYKPLAEGVRHFKEEEEGRDGMCESFEKLAKEYAEGVAEQKELDMVKELMSNMKWNIEQALNACGIQGDERIAITKALQK